MRGGGGLDSGGLAGAWSGPQPAAGAGLTGVPEAAGTYLLGRVGHVWVHAWQWRR